MSHLAESIYDLTIRYLNRFYEPGEVTSDVKKKAFRDMFTLLENGFTETEIIRAIEKSNNPPNIDPNKKGNKNLVQPMYFYFHPELRILPPPPKRVIDYNEGTIKKIDSEKYLEMKSTYTLDDLAGYYYRHFDGITGVRDSRKLQGAFKYMLKFYNVEKLLFMIDIASNHVKAGDARMQSNEPFFIEDYKREAELAYQEKRTTEVQAGVNKIVPKKRTIVGRSGNTSS